MRSTGMIREMIREQGRRDRMVGVPKNYGQGVQVESWRAGGLRGLVRLGRTELWTRLDRNMTRSSGDAGSGLPPRRRRQDAGSAA